MSVLVAILERQSDGHPHADREYDESDYDNPDQAHGYHGKLLA